jgi:hypothetical protein
MVHWKQDERGVTAMTNAAQFIDAAKALQPQIRACANAIEKERRLPFSFAIWRGTAPGGPPNVDRAGYLLPAR